MDHCRVAQIGLSLLCIVQGVATAVIDLNRTHAGHPDWPGHARFHVVWQTIVMMMLSVVELDLTWLRTPFRAEAFSLACVLAGMSPVAFLVALAFRRRFGGSLSDPRGIRPAQLHYRGREIVIDLNLVAVVVALAALAGIVAIYRM